ncbi:MAG: ankyrin repeat domain-containing protein [Pararobbsia sp.]
MKSVRSMLIAALLGCTVTAAVAQKTAQAPTGATAAAVPVMSGEMTRAAQLDYAARVKDLIKRGESPNATDDHGVPLIVYAAKFKADSVVAALAENPDTDLDAVDPAGENALMLAAINQDQPMVQLLLDKDAEVNKTGWTPLHYAASGGDDAIVKLLLDHAAYIDAGSPNGSTPLMMAAAAGHETTIKLLIDEGADVTIKNQLGLNAADIAKRYNQHDIADDLSKRIADKATSKPAAGAGVAPAKP